MNIIEFKDVNYSYNKGPTNSLDNINLSIERGEFTIISGKSGSGKTTLTRCINGLIPHFFEGELEGDVFIDGKAVSYMEIHDIAKRVGSVFQDPRSQFFTTDTTAEVAFGCENFGVPRDEILDRIEKTFNILKMSDLRDRSVFDLSSGEKQKIMLASVHALQPDIYVLDEPSSNLDIQTTRQLREILSILKRKGCTIVIAEHRLYYLKDLVDKLVYLDEGRIVKEYSKHDIETLSPGQLSENGLRQFDLYAIRLNNPRTTSQSIEHNEPSISFQADGISYYYNKKILVLKDINVNACGGEIIGITGRNGCGKTTLARIFCGLLKEKSGRVVINGEKMRKSKQKIKNTYYVMQDADYQLYAESVEEELKLGNEKVEQLETKIDNALQRLNLATFRDRHPASLSGGQKQRLTVSVSLVRDSNIVIFDEPTSGLDAGNMNRLSSMLQEMAKNKKLVFVISHDYEFLVKCCNRILNIQNGVIREDFQLNQNHLNDLRKVLKVDM